MWNFRFPGHFLTQKMYTPDRKALQIPYLETRDDSDNKPNCQFQKWDKSIGSNYTSSLTDGCSYRSDNIFSIEGNVLNTSTSIIIHIFLDLTFPLARRGFINWHLDRFFVICDDNGSQGWVLCVNLWVIHRPETMEHEVFLIPFSHWSHLCVWLVPHNMINEV